MKLPKLSLQTYERWLDDLIAKGMPAASMLDGMITARATRVGVMPTHEGCIITFTSDPDQTTRVVLNAAQANHLFRALAQAGVDGGWMDRHGNPLTEPRATQDRQPWPRPRDLKK
ncbi:hypothetical protein [Chachezhania sediminis]|uniref:hypothetical protein n=1 Tax=Chachezhania sediminis TaxID=2599291 RepID=UPI00131B6C0D|nr:hypothetical protein [Chachezhania sediminis]